MSDSPELKPDVPPLPSSFNLIATLGVVAMLSGFLVVLVYEYTRPIIAENQRIATERAIFKVLPQAFSRLTFTIENGQLKPLNDSATTDGEPIYAGYDKNGEFVGMALPAAEQGYQDIVRLLYGYHPETGCITGFDVLKSTETPGFGTKISTDEEFLNNFVCLEAQPREDSDLAHEIKTVRHGTKQNPWEIDAISGSTITSNAVGRMFNKSGQKFHPIIARYLDQLKTAKDHEKPTH